MKRHNCCRNVPKPGRRANKNALRPQNCKGRRAVKIALVVPPFFVDASRHQPCRVLTYSSPITGATGRVLLSLTRFLLAAPGFYSQCVTYGLCTDRPLSGCTEHLLLVPSKLLVYSVVIALFNVYHATVRFVNSFGRQPPLPQAGDTAQGCSRATPGYERCAGLIQVRGGIDGEECWNI